VNQNEVMALATDGVVKQLADELDVSLSRMYELLGKDNAYPKLLRIARPLGRLKPAGLRLLQADFNSFCESILSSTQAPVSSAEIHKELSDVVQAHLAEKSAAEQRQELIEAVAVCQHRLNDLNALN
jgi:hypothetical protein